MRQAAFLVLLFLFSVAPSFSFTGRVVAVLDGDTIEVLPLAPRGLSPSPGTLPSAGRMRSGKAERIGLTGIDCPEKKQAFGQRAKQATSALSFGQHVTVHSAGKDRYKRTLAVVELPDGMNLNYELVRQGWCWWYRKYAPDYAILQALEAEAREEKKGLWVDPNPVPPWAWRKRGKAVH